MPFLAPAIPAIAGLIKGGTAAKLGLAGASALGGFLNNRKSARLPAYSARQQGLQDDVLGGLSERLKNPRANLDPLKTAAIGNVNRGFDSVAGRMEAAAAGRGFGRSGKALLNRQQLELARAGELGGLESKFAGMQLDYENDLYDRALRAGFANPGQPGSGLGSAFSQGAETLTFLSMLNKLKGGGGFGGFGTPPFLGPQAEWAE